MVNKEKINSILTEIINTKSEFIDKCKKPDYSLNSLNNYVKHAFNKFNKEYTFRKKIGKIEHAINVRNNGKTISPTMTGNGNSVPNGYNLAFDSLIKNTCKDILEDYKKHKIKQDDAINNIIDRLNETDDGIFHIHNHPGPYKGAKFDSPISTCLSEADVVNTFLKRDTLTVGNRNTYIYNAKRCQMATSSNGTSMILINHNPITKYVDKRGYTDKQFNHAYDTLRKEWLNYLHDTEKKMYNTLWNKELKNNSSEYKGLNKNQLRKKIEKKIFKEIQNSNRNEFPKFANKAVQEFKDIGFELKFDFSDVMLNENG